MAMIEISDLCFSYGEQIGIDGLNLEIEEGEIFGFLGENGAGKTTTIRCMMSILVHQSGSIRINGSVVDRGDLSYKEEVGYLPGELSIPESYKVRDFFKYMASLRTKPTSRLDEIVRRFDIPMDKRVKQLSKGNKQKVGIALALMHDPKVLILDEPSSGLDPILQQELYNLLHEEKEKGKTIFFSSHNLDEVQRICDRVAIIRQGKLVSVEDVRDLAKDVSRKLIARVEQVKEDLLSGFEYSVSGTEITVQVGGQSLSAIMDALKEMNLLDLNYPPASLETYFLEKYRSE